MRIISGKYKGRVLEGYEIDGTRPTQDRVKESLFAMIQEDIVDANCLDLFTGTGNLGIEALSNGASSCYFVDHNSKCIDVLTKNLRNIDHQFYHIFCLDYNSALDKFIKDNIKFDIIFLDPPYHLDCLDEILKKIEKYDLLNEDGIVICEYEFENFSGDYFGLELEKARKYGYKNIRIYRRIQ